MATFTINGEQYAVPTGAAADMTLNTFIREQASLKGTKVMCREGGCGACIVSVTSSHPVTNKMHTYAINSCLVPVFSCPGWAVTTIEGVGNVKDGYHPIQKRLAQLSGTQCGYCSPGMVMNMYSLSKDKQFTMAHVENAFGGNICRCTGYRPILDAFKSFATDATPELKNKCLDIEDLNLGRTCPNMGKGTCKRECLATMQDSIASNGTEDTRRIKVTTIQALFEAISKIGNKPYRLVAGSTAHGVYRDTVDYDLIVDVRDISELVQCSTLPQLTLGANVSLTEAMELLTETSKNPGYGYTIHLAKHIDLVANMPVRNVGTIAGNLAIKHAHRDFPSDVFLILEAIGAKLTIMGIGMAKCVISLASYLDLDMKKKIIYNIKLPSYTNEYIFRTYKVMPRSQNSHAYVNAGFLFKLDSSGRVLEIPNIVFGGINPEFIHASETENYLVGKILFNSQTFQGALRVLENEINPDMVLPDASTEFRKGLAASLFYKYVLSLKPGVAANLVSGGKLLERPLSSGKQDYETDKSLWPLTEPVPKLEALVQCSGEAQYVNDIPNHANELHAAFVLSKVAQGTITKIDATEALNVKGVIAFYDVNDIPGKNNFTPSFMFPTPEEVFCAGEIKHAGQPIGLIVAETHEIANEAVKKVKVEILNPNGGKTSFADVVKSRDESRITLLKQKEAKNKEARKHATHILNGSFMMGSQYHYTMETQCCLVVPTEDGLDVYPSSQWMDLVQNAISQALKIPQHAINVVVRRLGGGYGGKISRGNGVSTACALAAHLLNRPVRFVLNLEANMEACGKRVDNLITYEVGVDDSGVIKYMDCDFYQNAGWCLNEAIVTNSIEHMVSCYEDDTWNVAAKIVRTDVTSHTWCRAPGSTEGIAAIEAILEHIARVLRKDTVEVKLANMKGAQNPVRQMITDHMQAADYHNRKALVDKFNKENRWRKKGIAIVPMTYGLAFWGNFYALVSIYANDGTVSVAHGGIEMGQGINTKVAQVVAHTLNIPLKLVTVKPSNTLTAPNNIVTGGSIGSETCCYAAMMCCKQLLDLLEPIKKKLEEPTWQQVIGEAYKANVDLCSTYMFTAKDKVSNYDIHGVTIAEVEVDVLTGQQQILRVDILEDTGSSMSPEVDVGQVEGAFVMGIGYWLTETLVYNPDTGVLLTNRTWNYKTPGAKDIPIDFRITFQKNNPNPTGVLRSKATGEPPLCMSVVVMFAVRYALNSARADSGSIEPWYTIDAPATTENIFLKSMTNSKQFTL